MGSDVDRWERRGARQGDREAKSEGWSVGSDAALDKETEEDRRHAGEQEGNKGTMMASPWGTQESGVGGLQVDARVDGRDKRKAPCATADKTGTWGPHGASQGKGGNGGDRREKVGAEPSGVGENNGDREASIFDPKSHGVGEGDGGRAASGVADKLGGGRHGVGGGVESPQGADTPGMEEGPRGDETLGSPTASQGRRGEDGRGQGGGDGTPATAQATREQ